MINKSARGDGMQSLLGSTPDRQDDAMHATDAKTGPSLEYVTPGGRRSLQIRL